MEKKDSLDFNINLILGEPISVEDKFKIRQFKIKEIRNSIGFYKYYQYINAICIDKLSIKLALNTIENVDPFDFIIANCYHDASEHFSSIICDGLSLFLGETVDFDRHIAKLCTEKNIIGKLDFEDIVNGIRKINCMGEEDNIKIENEVQLEYYSSSRIAKAKYAKNSESDLSDIISAVCSKHPSINIFNVEELTIYQLTDQYKRLNAIDQYLINIKSLLAGADKKDINLKHWSEKL